MDSWVRSPPSMHKIAGTFKVKIKMATPTGQLGPQRPANRTSLFTSLFLFQNPSFAMATASSQTLTSREIDRGARKYTVQCTMCCISSFKIDI